MARIDREPARPSKKDRAALQSARAKAQTTSPNESISRRRFLTLGGIGVGGLVLGGGLYAVKERSTPESAVAYPPTKEALLNTIDTLPPSEIKDLLIDRVRPYFTSNAPKTITRAGLSYAVYPTQFKYTTTRADSVLDGSSSLFWLKKSEGLPIVKTENLRIPYKDFLTPTEQQAWTEGRFPDGTPYIPINIAKGTPVAAGVAPYVTLDFLSKETFQKQKASLQPKIAKVADWIFLKEACSLLVADCMMGVLTNEMRQQHESPTVTVQKPRGGTTQYSVLSMVDFYFSQTKGRGLSSTDKAGAAVALQAVAPPGSPIPDYISAFDPNLTADFQAIQAISLRGGPDNIFRNVMQWAATTGSDNLVHMGNSQIFP